MATFNTQYYQEQEDALYSDGTIEDEIYERVCRQDKTLEMDSEWAVFYHFSRQRQNILNWYPFPDSCSILEIGAGCGALTGMLTQRAAHVTACELTMRRAKILFQRCQDAGNLEVVVGNFLRASFDRCFDYIIVNGVLEYAPGIMGEGTNEPFLAFLKHAKSFLNPGGKLLIAIENRFGQKYFAGAPEDHIGTIFAGINGYRDNDSVRTFSREELTCLCEDAGLQIQRWYYPYPDYKFPTEIFTDDSINEIVPSTPDVPYDMPRAVLYDKRETHRFFMKNKIAAYFSNSFLIEVGNECELSQHLPTYVKISNNRNPAFGVCTLVYQKESVVEKKALYPNGKQHIKKMTEYSTDRGMLRTVPSRYCDGTIIYQFVEQENLREVLEKLVDSRQMNRFWDRVNVLKDSLYEGVSVVHGGDPEFSSVFGECRVQSPLHWQANVNIDLNAENIFCGSENWTVIDNEWVFPFEIPAEYALWRMLKQLQENEPFASVLVSQDIYDFLGIGPTEEEVFRQWEAHFANHYVGIHDLSGHRKPSYLIDLNEVMEREKKRQMIISQLFLFPEYGEPSVLKCQAQNRDGTWIVRFRSKDIKSASSIRWDPLEGSACRISQLNAGTLEIQACNAEDQEPEYTFATFDPQFSLSGDWSELEQIELSFKCELIDWTAGYFKREVELNHERELRTQEEVLRAQVAQENEHLKTALRERTQLVQTAETQLATTAEKLHMSEKRISCLEGHIRETEYQMEELDQNLAATQEELQRREQRLNEVAQKISEQELDLEKLRAERNRLITEIEKHPWKTAAKVLFKKTV